jgi:uncharacterized protein (TIGR03905 family)
MYYEYKTRGVCSRSFELELENDIIMDLKVEGGCNGNLQGIMRLVQGRKVDDIIALLEGIRCDSKPTSCPDQLAKALKEFKSKEKIAS